MKKIFFISFFVFFSNITFAKNIVYLDVQFLIDNSNLGIKYKDEILAIQTKINSDLKNKQNSIKEKELVMPRVDSTEVVSIAELATKTIVQVQVGTLTEDGEFLSAGGGSGVVITNDGLIMTNHHVIDNSTEVRVIFEDGRMYEANIIGSDRLTDIGLSLIHI